jgi:hypothetical protein
MHLENQKNYLAKNQTNLLTFLKSNLMIYCQLNPSNLSNYHSLMAIFDPQDQYTTEIRLISTSYGPVAVSTVGANFTPSDFVTL